MYIDLNAHRVCEVSPHHNHPPPIVPQFVASKLVSPEECRQCRLVGAVRGHHRDSCLQLLTLVTSKSPSLAAARSTVHGVASPPSLRRTQIGLQGCPIRFVETNTTLPRWKRGYNDSSIFTSSSPRRHMTRWLCSPPSGSSNETRWR